MSTESIPQRVGRIASMLASGNVAPLAYATWLRWNRLEFAQASYQRSEHCNDHQHSGGPALEQALRDLALPRNTVAMDLGAGMGIAALTLERFYRKVIGVELSAELVEIARRNLARVRSQRVEIFCADARTFDGMDDVGLVYMFNPFTTPVMVSVLENLNRSIERSRRPVTILYKHPACHDSVVAAGFRHVRDIEVKHSHSFAVYAGPPQ